MPQYFRPNIAAMSGYMPGEQPQDANVIKLNTNENPYGPSPKVLATLRRSTNASLRLYPEPQSDTLRAAAAAVYRVRPGNIIVGNGSDELLSMLLRCFVGQKERVAYPVPTYSLYDTLVAIQDGVAAPVSFPPDFSLPVSLADQNARLTFLCNPNAPSGTLVPPTDIEALARSITGVLVLDEAYIDFAEVQNASAMPLIDRVPNLIVLRTFSKSFSLAGLRIGIAFAAEDIIAGMMKVKDSYNVNRLSLLAATAALEDLSWMTRNAQRIRASRKKLTAGLKRLGYDVYPSHANFVLARQHGQNLRPVYEELKRKKILVRYFDVEGLRDCLRITVGKPSEIKLLLEAMAEIGSRTARLASGKENDVANQNSRA